MTNYEKMKSIDNISDMAQFINTFPELLAGMLDCLWYS